MVALYHDAGHHFECSDCCPRATAVGDGFIATEVPEPGSLESILPGRGV